MKLTRKKDSTGRTQYRINGKQVTAEKFKKAKARPKKKAVVRKKVFSGKAMTRKKKSRKQISKKIKYVPAKKFKKVSVKNPDGTTFDAQQIRVHVGSPKLTTAAEVLSMLVEVESEVIRIVKQNFKRGDGLAIGYNFTLYFGRKEATQQGFTNRLIISSKATNEISRAFEVILEDLLARFEIYLKINKITAVSLEDIILEKTSASI